MIEAVRKEAMPRACNARDGATSIAQAEVINAAAVAIKLTPAAESASACSHAAYVASAAMASNGAATEMASRTGYSGFSIQSVYPQLPDD